MRGRKPKPEILKMGNGDGHKRPSVTAPAGYPNPPAFLDAVAMTEWHRVCASLDEIGTLSPADGPALAAYCATWSRYCTLLGQFTTPTVTTADGNVVQHPTLSAIHRTESEIRKWLCEFGLTPSSRSRVRAAPRRAGVIARDRVVDKSKFFAPHGA